MFTSLSSQSKRRRLKSCCAPGFATLFGRENCTASSSTIQSRPLPTCDNIDFSNFVAVLLLSLPPEWANRFSHSSYHNCSICSARLLRSRSIRGLSVHIQLSPLDRAHSPRHNATIKSQLDRQDPPRWVRHVMRGTSGRRRPRLQVLDHRLPISRAPQDHLCLKGEANRTHLQSQIFFRQQRCRE